MNTKNYIAVNNLCTHYKVDMSFFSNLSDIGLIEIITIERSQYIHQDKIYDIEKMIRIHYELNVNIEGIDIVFNLLQKIDDLQNDLISTKNRLRLYEK